MSKIKLKIPTICNPEIKYIFQCFLRDFIGLDYVIETHDNLDFELLNGENSIIIKNHFFLEDDIAKLYTIENIPKATTREKVVIRNKSFEYQNLYGIPKFDVSENQCVIHTDIISSSFFMLSRWEESVIKDRDRHNRFEYKSALSVIENFYQFPVVNEYVEILSEILMKYNFLEKRKEQKYEPIISFDIDHVYKWYYYKTLLVSLYVRIKTLRFSYIFSDIVSFIKVKFLNERDPYNNFQYLFESLKGRKLKKILYFKPIITDNYFDKNKYDISTDYFNEVFDSLTQNNLQIGIHPSYESHLNSEIITNEKDELEKYSKLKIKHSRQHYLRFEIPKTYSLLDENNIEFDSSMMYAKSCGFRNGVCFPFQVFDFLSRKTLKIKEIPLLFMETTYIENSKNIIPNFIKINEQVRKYEGTNMVLWHNSNLIDKDHKNIYKKLLDILE